METYGLHRLRNARVDDFTPGDRVGSRPYVQRKTVSLLSFKMYSSRTGRSSKVVFLELRNGLKVCETTGDCKLVLNIEKVKINAQWRS